MGIIYKDGIPYGNQPSIDATLTLQGEAADAKAVGDAVSELRNTLNHKAPIIYDTASGEIASFPDGADGLPVKDLTVGIEPVQSGTGDPSPTNVRPISGVTGMNVNVAGKNLLPMTVAGIKSANTNGIWNGNAYTYNGVTFEVSTDSNGNVIAIKSSGTSSNTIIFLLFSNNTRLYTNSMILSGCPNGGSNSTFFLAYGNKIDYGSGCAISPDTSGSIYIYVGTSVNMNNIVFYPMIRFSTDTDATFAPYTGTGTTLPISWQSEAGTVYGGTLDVTTGVLVVDRKYISLSNLAWHNNRTGTYTHECYVDTAGKKFGVANIISDKLKTAAYEDNLDYAIRGFQNEDSIAVRVPITVASNELEMEQWVNSNDIHACYELATPLAIQLDPVTVTTLLGQNNVWADCGPVSVEYPADTKLYIQKINTPTDDDMIADANIASGQYFIVNNNLYISTAAILAGDPIKPGTNCTLTNLAAALNALNS